MTEMIIVSIACSVAIAYLAWRLYRVFQGKSDCGCSCKSCCKSCDGSCQCCKNQLIEIKAED